MGPTWASLPATLQRKQISASPYHTLSTSASSPTRMGATPALRQSPPQAWLPRTRAYSVFVLFIPHLPSAFSTSGLPEVYFSPAVQHAPVFPSFLNLPRILPYHYPSLHVQILQVMYHLPSTSPPPRVQSTPHSLAMSSWTQGHCSCYNHQWPSWHSLLKYNLSFHLKALLAWLQWHQISWLTVPKATSSQFAPSPYTLGSWVSVLDSRFTHSMLTLDGNHRVYIRKKSSSLYISVLSFRF